MYLSVEFLQEPQVDRLRAASLTLHDEKKEDEEVVDLADLNFSPTYLFFVLSLLFLKGVWAYSCVLCFDLQHILVFILWTDQLS